MTDDRGDMGVDKSQRRRGSERRSRLREEGTPRTLTTSSVSDVVTPKSSSEVAPWRGEPRYQGKHDSCFSLFSFTVPTSVSDREEGLGGSRSEWSSTSFKV